MKVIVGVKRVVDYNIKIRVKTDGSGVERTNVRMSMNPFDEIALEEAVRLRENGVADRIIAVSIGMSATRETLRTALAMGADHAVLVECEMLLEPLDIARVFKEIAGLEKADLVILGKQAIDDDYNQTGQMLAGLLGWGQATFASTVKIQNGEAIVSREVDSGIQTIAVCLPAVITADLRLNEPRYASLPNIMKARKKPVELRTLSSLGVSTRTRFKVMKVEEPKARQPGIRVGNVIELAEKIRHIAGIHS